MEFSEDPEDTIKNALDYLMRKKWVNGGQKLIVISNALAKDVVIDTLHIRTAEKKKIGNSTVKDRSKWGVVIGQ